ncbi:helix-turn-helix transcriptional regulator [Naasia sp. SYSU D00948]|uniref:helix-turn-helix transcriptional regulator n=1 Tax=Naasia sp. SYSU D00948 TaxID=2817379 RepID=UPI001B302DF2|nr:helix-turn-helix transcriptional regulator [Naasia sp. SYSU D00948]
MPPAATKYALFQADDLASANAAMRSVRPTVAMLAPDAEEPLAYTHEAYGFPGLRLASLSIGGTVLAGVGEEDAVTVVWTTSGRLRYDYRNAGGDQTDRIALAPGPVLPNNPGSATVVMEDAALQVATIDRARLEDTARTLYGDDEFRVQFAGPRPLSPQLAAFWTKAQEITWKLVAEGAAEHPMMRASLFRSMAVATLESFALMGDQERRFRTVMAQTNAYHRGVRFLEDHASLPVTIDDAAQAAGVPTRSLLRAFQAHSPEGRTPAEHLRRVRLDAAHADLVSRRGSTVREIALRWGFADPSAFSRAYKAVYKVTPGTTLSR